MEEDFKNTVKVHKKKELKRKEITKSKSNLLTARNLLPIFDEESPSKIKNFSSAISRLSIGKKQQITSQLKYFSCQESTKN